MKVWLTAGVGGLKLTLQVLDRKRCNVTPHIQRYSRSVGHKESRHRDDRTPPEKGRWEYLRGQIPKEPSPWWALLGWTPEAIVPRSHRLNQRAHGLHRQTVTSMANPDGSPGVQGLGANHHLVGTPQGPSSRLKWKSAHQSTKSCTWRTISVPALSLAGIIRRGRRQFLFLL